MDLTPSIPSPRPADAAASSPAPGPTISIPAVMAPPDGELQAAVQRVLREAVRSTGRSFRREDLLLHLLCEPDGLGPEALQAAGAKPERVRAELLRLMGHADGTTRPPVEPVPWPLSRWAWIAAVLSSVGYPLSIGPVMMAVDSFDLDHWALEVVYLPIIWLYEAVPIVKTFYDWYLPAIGYS